MLDDDVVPLPAMWSLTSAALIKRGHRRRAAALVLQGYRTVGRGWTSSAWTALLDDIVTGDEGHASVRNDGVSRTSTLVELGDRVPSVADALALHRWLDDECVPLNPIFHARLCVLLAESYLFKELQVNLVLFI